MASILIENLPNELLQRLTLCAQKHHRSLNKEVIALIEATLSSQATEGQLESTTSHAPLAQGNLSELQQKRTAQILSLRGKYKHAVSSSIDFAKRKAAEIALDH